MTFGMRSMTFECVQSAACSKHVRAHSSTCALFAYGWHFFHASPNPLVLPQKPVRISFPQVDSHDFAGDSRFLHGPHELEKHEHHETDDVPMDFSLTPDISARRFLP